MSFISLMVITEERKLKVMIEFIGELIGQLFLLIPSKKQKVFKKKYKILKQQQWF
ncbi:hypothetical protein [Bacillus thuringiensis]|nr:hypothetical protein [Bacillus thuringiensis]